MKALFLFLMLTLLVIGGGCAENEPASSPADPSTQFLQIFRSGDKQPLSFLGGLHPGDQVLLEVKGVEAGVSIQWFTAASTNGEFSSPGVLHVKKAGRFLIGAVTGEASAYVKVEVEDRPSTGGSLPPGEDPGNPDPPDDPDPAPPADDKPPPSVPSDSFMDEVTAFNPGPHAGFGSPQFPQIVLGPPQGGGLLMGGLDVLSLGTGGEIILKSETPILDGAGDDFIVFENAFYAGGNPNAPFVELGQVAVSQDGVTFFSFPCATQNTAQFYPGCAGVHPVLANSELNDIDPTDPAAAGGDAFDLADLHLSWARYVKVRDLSTAGAGVSAGFDLDAIAIIHQ